MPRWATPGCSARSLTLWRADRARKPDNAERLQLILEHIDRTVAFKGERLAVLQMRTHIGHYIRGLPGATDARKALNTVKSTAEQKDLLRRMLTKESE